MLSLDFKFEQYELNTDSIELPLTDVQLIVSILLGTHAEVTLSWQLGFGASPGCLCERCAMHASFLPVPVLGDDN